MKVMNPAALVTAAMCPCWLNAMRRGSPPTLMRLGELPSLQREDLDQPRARERQVRLAVIRRHADAEGARLQSDAVHELARGEVELVEPAPSSLAT